MKAKAWIEPTKAWAAPLIDGIRQDHLEVELDTDGTTALLHVLPWYEVSYRYEYEPSETSQR